MLIKDLSAGDFFRHDDGLYIVGEMEEVNIFNKPFKMRAAYNLQDGRKNHWGSGIEVTPMLVDFETSGQEMKNFTDIKVGDFHGLGCMKVSETESINLETGRLYVGSPTLPYSAPSKAIAGAVPKTA